MSHPEASLFDKKKKLRSSIIRKRSDLSVSHAHRLSRLIEKKLFIFKPFIEAQSVLFYIQFNNEVSTEMMIKKSIDMGKRVSIPVTMWREKKLYLTEIKDLDKEIEISRFGIPEPHSSFFMPVDLDDIDMVIVPGVAFDEKANRLGYGGGFYDRLLQDKRVRTIALAYDFQIVERLPSEDHDISMDFIISEKREIFSLDNNQHTSQGS